MKRALVVVLLLAGCRKHDPQTIEPAAKHDAPSRLLPAEDAATVELPPAPAMPGSPAGLPPLPINPLFENELALGELLFYDGRLATDGKTSCATCHDPAAGYAGKGLQPTAKGTPNTRRAPSLVNLAYRTAFGWDGGSPTLAAFLEPHIVDQLGAPLASSMPRIADLPLYRAHVARIARTDPRAPAAVAVTALQMFAATRYEGDSPWDHDERAPDAPADPKAGYRLFTGKAQCAVCHTPPLYTDLASHRLAGGEPVMTPTVRGAAARAGFFHDARATTLDAAIDGHPVDPTVKPLALTATERAQLGAFVRALTANRPPPARPVLP